MLRVDYGLAMLAMMGFSATQSRPFSLLGVRKNTVDLSTAVQKAARLEAAIMPEGDQAATEKQEQVAALLAAAEAIIADQELREFMTERNRAAIDASILLFGNKGVIKVGTASS